ncbi:hypothetical protein [Allomuricauda sp. CP2A]|jgi:hypothetical protein|uniref:hypothetical protein n=1 Tax=Allomuricauda sp. CP2A TaxID=1848189 RepID=UPI00082BE799|nr:hypothetical protein [Muricauda sp. CP2A]
MLDLNALQAKIDNLWETETSDSLSNWLFQKRLSDINTIIGDGEFVSIPTKNAQATFEVEPIQQRFDSEDTDFDPIPPHRQAA